jgi:hypothetical protein
VPRVLAEEAILAPIVEKLLSPAFVAHAVKTIRELARREREAPPAEVTAAVAQADAQIAELKRLVREGALTAAVAAPALATAHKQRQTALRPASRRTARTSESLDFRVEEAFRETVAHMGRVLRGDNLIEARGVAPPDCRNRPAAPGRGSSDSEVRTRGNSATYSSEW